MTVMNALRGTVLVLLLLSAGVQSQEPATGAAAAPPPDPSALANDWWRYIEEAGDQLNENAAALKKLLAARDDLDTETDGAGLSVMRDEILQTLDIYVDLKSRTPAAPQPAPAAAAQYTLPAVLELVGVVRDLALEVDLEREELSRRNKALKTARQELDNLRAAYFELGIQAPTRLAHGLRIMRDRLRLATAGEELRLLKPQIEQKESRLRALREELEAAASRLIASRADVESYEKQAEAANQTVTRLTDEAAFYRLRSTGVADTPEDHAEARRARQRLVDFDVRIATAELARAQARVAAAFARRLDAETGGAADLRQTLEELKQRLKETEALRGTWRRASDGERAAAEAQLSLSQDGNSALAEIHRTRIQQTDNTLQALAALREQLAKGQMLAELAEKRVVRDEGWFAAWWTDTRLALNKSWTVMAQWTTDSLFTINETPVTLFGLFRVLIILSIAWWISKIVRHGLDRVAGRREAMNRASLYTVGRLFHYTILIIGILVGLSSIGLDFTKLALFVSALGVGLGFGLQAIFSNFVAGLIILFERSLKVGDFVDLESGVTGEVREINIRSTLVTTNDNIDILVPNSEFVSGRVINWTLREAYRRVRVPFGVAYGTDKELVKKAALEAAVNVPFTLTSIEKRRPQVWLVELGDSSLNFELVVWLVPEAVSRPGAVQAAYTWEIESMLSKYGIEIPFPQRDLHLRSGFDQTAALQSDKAGDRPREAVAGGAAS